ncbi:MAG: hypothetical protein ACR2OI_01210, partial [Acidimicrobiia bacterium]
AVAQATLLPIAFVSDVFLVTEDGPAWMEAVGNFFPLKHFVIAFGDAFNPTLSGNGFAWSGTDNEYAIGIHLAVMLAWGIGAAIVAVKFFKWEPNVGRVSRRSKKADRVSSEA